MKLSNYKTYCQKRRHIEKYWTKKELFDLVDVYTEFDHELHYSMMSCKTKKELLDNYLDKCWEFVSEEYRYV